jgi:hypothetical protein
MNVRRLVAAMAAVTSVVGVAASADAVEPRSVVVLEGLQSPGGLAVDKSGALIIGQTANWTVGDQILKVPLTGPNRLQPTPVAEGVVPNDVAINPTNGRLWIAAGEQVMRQRVDGSFATVIDMGAYQDGDPDPVAQLAPRHIGEPEIPIDPTASRPAGLAFRSNGELLVADQANNDLVLVLPNGTARTVARFDTELLPVAWALKNLSGIYVPEDELNAPAAPVAVMIGNDGFIYVGEQKGFPYTEDTSRVWRIDPAVLAPGAAPAWCSVNNPDSRCKVYASGFTAIVDIAAARPTQRGHIYVLEHSSPLYNQWVHDLGGTSRFGRLIRVSGNRSQVTVPTSTIYAPRNIVVMSGGAIYLTDAGDIGFEGVLMKIQE